MEEGHLLPSVKELYSVMAATHYRFEVIFVDDAGTDRTKELILQIAKEYPDVRYLMHEKNIGRGGSFSDGARISQGKYIGYLDIDLEVSAGYLPYVLKKLENGNDVVIVNRKYSILWTFSFLLRHLSSISYKTLVSLVFNTPAMDTESGFKFFTKESLLFLLGKTTSKKWFFDTEVMVLAHKYNYRIAQIEGMYSKNPEKLSTVRLFPDSMNQIAELLRFKRRIKKS